MVNVVVELSKYLMILVAAIYTYECFAIFGFEDDHDRKSILMRQNVMMFLMHFVAFLVMFLQTGEKKMLGFYGMQVLLFLAILILYRFIYPGASRIITNNMCMLLSIGFIMITRLSYVLAVKQFIIAAGALVISLFIPFIIHKMRVLSEWKRWYAILGVLLLIVVIIAGRRTGGALLSIKVGGMAVQPSELVKIIFVFFVAASFKNDKSFKNIVITTAIAAMHVLILVLSRDLGAALIIFAVYLVMLYVATEQARYVFLGIGSGSVAAMIAYRLFNHVRVRVLAWKNPFAIYHEGGQQMAQSLMAIGTGSWFGMGLLEGAADKIFVSESDFIFPAIAEEMGLIFAICLTLICVSVYVMFLNISMQLRNSFYKLIALGLGTCYIFQVFLNIGGVTKFIPSTGVTLPLVSYGGSSVLSTVIMFAIIQGLYILREDEEEDIERKKAEQEARGRSGSHSGRPSGRKSRKKTASKNSSTDGGRRAPERRRKTQSEGGMSRRPAIR